MSRRPLLCGVLTTAYVLCLPPLTFAQFHSFPGDWPQPGRGPGVGQSGYQHSRDALPFPYIGIDSSYGNPIYLQPYLPAAPVYPAVDTTRAYVHVRVPATAKVLFDDSPTRQSGPDRLFMTPPLAGDHVYTYEVSARWMQEGKERRAQRTVRVLPGQTVTVDFTSR